MDKSLLVVVLCLQVFLLITAFTSTDAAALVTDDQQQQSPDLVEGTIVRTGEKRQAKPKPEEPVTRSPIMILSQSDEGSPGHRKISTNKRGCNWKPGRCGGLRPTLPREGRPKPKKQPPPRTGSLSVIMSP